MTEPFSGSPRKGKREIKGKTQAKTQSKAGYEGPVIVAEREEAQCPAWTEEADALHRRFNLAGIISSEVQEVGLSGPPGQKGKSANKKPLRINKLSDLPDSCWEYAPHYGSGVQLHSRFQLGIAKVNMMLDTRSGVNSTTEEEVVQ